MGPIPVGKIGKKQSEGVFIKNTLLNTDCFSAILPTGIRDY